MSRNNTLTALCAGVCLSLLASAAHAESSDVFAGYNGWTDYDYGYIGGVTALNHDMKSDGWLVRGTAGYGEYSYSSRAVAGVNDVDLTNANLMVGFQKFVPNVNGGTAHFALYLGLDYQNDSLSKSDNTNPVRGDEFGVMGYGDIRLPLDVKTFLNEEGSYSGAFDTYRSTTHLGYYMNGFAIGPEVEFLGNQAFDSEHFGLFLSDIHIADTLTAALSGGYEHSARQFSSGGYGNVSVNYGF